MLMFAEFGTALKGISSNGEWIYCHDWSMKYILEQSWSRKRIVTDDNHFHNVRDLS